MKSPLRILVLGFTFFVLGGCSGVMESLGLGRNAPDEFAVLDHPPLSMPPDFRLRPPKPGTPRPQETSASDKASTVLLGSQDAAKKEAAPSTILPTPSDSEKALLNAAGVAGADPNVSHTVDRAAQ